MTQQQLDRASCRIEPSFQAAPNAAFEAAVVVQLETNVIRVPIVPGSDPRVAYGNLMERGGRGIVLESFGVGNMPDTEGAGW